MCKRVVRHSLITLKHVWGSSVEINARLDANPSCIFTILSSTLEQAKIGTFINRFYDSNVFPKAFMSCLCM